MRFESQADGMPPSVVAANSLGGRPQVAKEYLARRSPADRRDVSTVVPKSGRDEVAEAIAEAEASAVEPRSPEGGHNMEWLLRMSELLEMHQIELADFGARELGQVRRELIADAIGASAALRWLYAVAKLDSRLYIEESSDVEEYAQRRAASAALVNGSSAIDPACTALTRLAAALARGCITLLRPQPESAGTTTLLLDLLLRAGAPLDRLYVAHGGQDTEELLLDAARSRGWAILGQTASVPVYTPSRASPAVVLADADLHLAVPAIVAMALRASGQADDACHHVIVDRRVANHVRDELARRLARIVLGDPRGAETEMGPLLSEPMLHAWNELRGLGIGEGAELVVDGVRFDAPIADRVSSQGSVALNATPRLFARVTGTMALCSSVGRGPTLLVLESDGIGEALELCRLLGSLENLSLFSRDARVLATFRGRQRASAILLNPAPGLVMAAKRRAHSALLDAWDLCGRWQLVVQDSSDRMRDPEVAEQGASAPTTLAWPPLAWPPLREPRPTPSTQ